VFVLDSSLSHISHNQDSKYIKLKPQNMFLARLDISGGCKECMDNFGGEKCGKTAKEIERS
jgi:hypothetical protein